MEEVAGVRALNIFQPWESLQNSLSTAGTVPFLGNMLSCVFVLLTLKQEEKKERLVTGAIFFFYSSLLFFINKKTLHDMLLLGNNQLPGINRNSSLYQDIAKHV